jgi:hypothetical protein
MVQRALAAAVLALTLALVARPATADDSCWPHCPTVEEPEPDICDYVFSMPIPVMLLFFGIGVGFASGAVVGAITAAKKMDLHRARGQTVDGVCVKRWTTVTTSNNNRHRSCASHPAPERAGLSETPAFARPVPALSRCAPPRDRCPRCLRSNHALSHHGEVRGPDAKHFAKRSAVLPGYEGLQRQPQLLGARGSDGASESHHVGDWQPS